MIIVYICISFQNSLGVELHGRVCSAHPICGNYLDNEQYGRSVLHYNYRTYLPSNNSDHSFLAKYKLCKLWHTKYNNLRI